MLGFGMGRAFAEDAKELAENDVVGLAWRCLFGGGAIGASPRERPSLLEPALETLAEVSGGELENPKDDVLEPALESGVTCGVASAASSWRRSESSSTGCKYPWRDQRGSSRSGMCWPTFQPMS